MTDTRSTADNTANVGSKAPDFNLKDQEGKTHRLSDYRGRWVVLYFYPKDDTPGCTKEACQFRDQHADFSKINAAVLGVSPDDEASHAKFAKKFSLPFPLLADTDKTLCQAYDVWKEKNMYGIKRMGVVRTTVLIDPRGNIAHRWNNVKVDGHDQAILARIAELSA
jgi:peroxiredoxin Q/BCP